MRTTGKLIDRTLGNILGAWNGISIPFTVKRLELSPYLHTAEIDSLRAQIKECLEAKGGEVSARARAAELGKAYLGLNEEGRHKFLALLATEFGVNHDAVRSTAEALFTDLDPQSLAGVEQQLREQLIPQHLQLLTQFNALPQGIKFLVDLRADLLKHIRSDATLIPMDNVLRTRLSSWFDIGFLELRLIDWHAPAALLEKLIQYEAVHKIESWENLRHRLSNNRRCFAFFHPSMPDEPLVFVWVALVDNLSDNVDILLDVHSNSDTDEQDANTAIFYSITSPQAGLAGVSLGNFLIKRVVDELKRELPALETFSTLSPIPGFSKWLDAQIDQSANTVLTSEERNALAKLTDQTFKGLLDNMSWLADSQIDSAMKKPLCRLAAEYLALFKRKNNRASDSVANFHLSNGATVERINWRADNSERGKQQSYTVMVNYLYDLGDIEKNHEEYIATGKIAMSKPVAALLP